MLTRLGLYKLVREDPERMWRVARDIGVPAFIRHVLAPGYGYGADRVPEAGGVVLAFNHLSAIDPPLTGVYTRRTLYLMAKAELLDVPVAGEVLRMLGSFGVRRGEGDRDSLRVARWLLEHDHAVGLFLEGTRQPLGYPGRGHPGAAMLAIQEGVPLVPCGMETFGWSLANRRPCALVWGDPIDLGGLARNGRGYKEGTAILEQEILRLWRQAGEAVAAGFPERLPDGTRRHGHMGRGSSIVLDAEPWPREPWAARPLGPVYGGV